MTSEKPVNWRLFSLIGLADVAIGAGLVVAGLTGMLGEESQLFALFGGLFMLGGVGVVLLARHKLSQVEDRRGDLN